MNRQQEMMRRALADVTRIATEGDEEEKGVYGGLCHKLPILIRTCGLCQALAFVDAKAEGKGPRAGAHRRLREDVTHVLAQFAGVTVPVTNGNPGLLVAIADLPTAQYAHTTRILLQGLVFYKRFAVSVLKAEVDDYGEEDRDEGEAPE